MLCKETAMKADVFALGVTAIHLVNTHGMDREESYSSYLPRL